MKRVSPNPRDLLLRALPREILPGMELTFPDSQARYDSDREVVSFVGEALRHPVRCAVSREALEDHFGADGGDKEQGKAAHDLPYKPIENRADVENQISVLARRGAGGCAVNNRGCAAIVRRRLIRRLRSGLASSLYSEDRVSIKRNMRD